MPRCAASRPRIGATLTGGLLCALCLAGPARALDPSKRLTQYLHASWRIQDASAPAGMDR